jgi:hypothetical protein
LISNVFILGTGQHNFFLNIHVFYSQHINGIEQQAVPIQTLSFLHLTCGYDIQKLQILLYTDVKAWFGLVYVVEMKFLYDM